MNEPASSPEDTEPRARARCRHTSDSAKASPKRTTRRCWTPRTSSSAAHRGLLDNLNAHVSAPMTELIAARQWLNVYQLPHAPGGLFGRSAPSGMTSANAVPSAFRRTFAPATRLNALGTWRLACQDGSR